MPFSEANTVEQLILDTATSIPGQPSLLISGHEEAGGYRASAQGRIPLKPTK